MPADQVTVKIKGIRQLEVGAARLFDNIERAEATDAVHPTAEQTAATVRARVPRRTGRLANSVRVIDVPGRPRSQVSMGAGLEYARWIEYGGGPRRPYRRGGRYVLPTARRTARAFRKHAEHVCSQQIGRMRWPAPR